LLVVSVIVTLIAEQMQHSSVLVESFIVHPSDRRAGYSRFIRPEKAAG
jgi:hypothetical protein